MPKPRDKTKPYKRADPEIPFSVKSLGIIGRTHIRVIVDTEEAQLIDGLPATLFYINPANRLTCFTDMSEEELDIYKTMVNDAIERARPDVQELDRRAAEASEQGNLQYRRQWRTRPVYQNLDQQGTRRNAEQPDQDTVHPEPPGERVLRTDDQGIHPGPGLVHDEGRDRSPGLD